MSPPTGVDPACGCAEGAGCAAGVSACGVLLGGIVGGADCPHAIEASPNTSAARAVGFKCLEYVFMPRLLREDSPDGAVPLRSIS
jgi:hypothetical protein